MGSRKGVPEKVSNLMKMCEYCKTQYIENRTDQRFCSPKCQHSNWINNNPEKSKQYDRCKYENNKTSIIKRVSIWRKNNLQKARKYYADWKKRNPEKSKISSIARTKKWQKNNPLKVRALKLKRRCRLFGNGGVYSAKDWKVLLDKTQGICLMCRKLVGIENLTVDHIVPISLGGKNSIDNLQPLCHSCNAKKHTKIIRFRYVEEDLCR